MIDKLLLPFKLLSDSPEGEQAIKPYGLWDEPGRTSLPAIVTVGTDGRIRYFYRGQDFADRLGDEELLEALSGAGMGG